jgi:hypothetical protein
MNEKHAYTVLKGRAEEVVEWDRCEGGPQY